MASAVDEVKKARFTVSPTASDMAAILANTGDPGLLGYTKIDASSELICNAELTPDKDAGNCAVAVSPVSLKINSLYASPGLHDSGLAGAPEECPDKVVPIKFKISKDVANMAKTAEQEHCDDLTIAYKRTLEPCQQRLQKLLHGKTVPGDDKDSCWKEMVALLGYDPLDCTREFLTLANKSKERDDKGWHSFDPVRISGSCTEVIYELKKSATTKIGDPGEAPAKFIPPATKCGSPKAAPAPPGPPPVKPTPETPPPPSPEKKVPDKSSPDKLPPAP